MVTFSLKLMTLAACLFASSVFAQDFIGFDKSSFGNAVLKRNQTAIPGLSEKFEAQIGDYNNEPITRYSASSIFATMGRSVGRLDILTDKGVFPCTAFIIGENLLMTNYHCIPGILDDDRIEATRIEQAQFVAGYTQTGVEENTKKFTVVPQPLEADKALDYAILRVIGAPHREFGQLDLSARLPRDRDPFWIIGHPMGEGQRISREKCGANAPAQSKGRLLHTCDTLPGNSGSPVIDASTHDVIALHNAGSSRDAVNFAVPMYKILENSKIAVSGRRQNTVRLNKDDSLCDALYAEAKFHGECFAYRAYAERCATHAFVGFAQSFLVEHCTQASLPVPQEQLRPWCSGSGLSHAQEAVCTDAYLAQLDGQLAALAEALANRPGTARAVTDFERARDQCGGNVACIAQSYTNSLNTLRAIAAAPVEQPQPPERKDFSVFRNTDFPGGDLTARGIRDISVQSCANRCARMSGCVGFTYVEAKRWCWPKSRVVSRVAKSGMTSGLRPGHATPAQAPRQAAPGFDRHVNQDIPGLDLTRSGYRGVSIERCEQICMSSDTCVSYSYVTAKRWCWPKSDAGRRVPKAGIVSGILR